MIRVELLSLYMLSIFVSLTFFRNYFFLIIFYFNPSHILAACFLKMFQLVIFLLCQTSLKLFGVVGFVVEDDVVVLDPEIYI